ncbi:MAG: flagellar export protein FliJ [Clostridiales bacterium]|nr:flagellar export protein FliJ [Clostridiales bacterium]
MAKFVYRMQNILNLKEKMEDQKKSAYRNAAAKLEEEENILNGLEQKKKSYEEQLKESFSETVPILDLMEVKKLHEAVEIMKGQIRFQQIAVANARRKAEIARLELGEAMQERKIQEKLKEHAFEQFKLEINEDEKKEIDQLVSFQYGKKKP